MRVDLYSKNPERVLELEQINKIKRSRGCAVCVRRDLRAMAIGGLACSLPGNYPRPVYCDFWELDEGEAANEHKTQAA